MIYAIRNKKTGQYAHGKSYVYWGDLDHARTFTKIGYLKTSIMSYRFFKRIRTEKGNEMKFFDPNIEVVELELNEVRSYKIKEIYKEK